MTENHTGEFPIKIEATIYVVYQASIATAEEAVYSFHRTENGACIAWQKFIDRDRMDGEERFTYYIRAEKLEE